MVQFFFFVFFSKTLRHRDDFDCNIVNFPFLDGDIPNSITKACLYNFDPLIPHFYIVKLGFTGGFIIFLITAQNIDCGTR